MTLQQMEYIVALDKYRHFVLAAEACGVTQPTLSAMIQKLEEELDVKIFNRDRKNITPTRIGEKIIRQAQIVLNETQCINRQHERQSAHRHPAYHRSLPRARLYLPFPENLSACEPFH